MNLKEFCEKEKKQYLLDEWDGEKNLPFTPETVSSGSNIPVWWKCEKGHSWEASVCTRSRTRENRKGSFCPICIGKQVLKGFNDLETVKKKVYNLTGFNANIIRFPGGASNTTSKKK